MPGPSLHRTRRRRSRFSRLLASGRRPRKGPRHAGRPAHGVVGAARDATWPPAASYGPRQRRVSACCRESRLYAGGHFPRLQRLQGRHPRRCFRLLAASTGPSAHPFRQFLLGAGPSAAPASSPLAEAGFARRSCICAGRASTQRGGPRGKPGFPREASAKRYAGARSIWMRGSQPSQVGRYQFQRPSSFIAAGRITERISVASISRAIATPKPICWN
jgi:hypothetical protein